MKNEVKMATFTFCVPLTFKFNAQRDTDNETLWKMAESYLDLAIRFGDFDVNEKLLDLIKEEKVLTAEEKAEERRRALLLDDILGITGRK